jgi:hypothetical protein
LRRAIAAALLAVGMAAAGVAAADPSAPREQPTRAQLDGLDAFREAVGTYERGGADYREAITAFIALHYQQKRRVILGSLDREIAAEKTQLRQARETTIRRLERFVASHVGPNANVEATPDAMYRLAALYEEQARSEADSGPELAAATRPAIALYKRIIREFPAYRELAGVYYFLGHALNDARRTTEAQQVWRSLVCHDRYPYPVAPDPSEADRDQVTPLEGDNDLTFRDPYPGSCIAIARFGAPGADSKYVAEVWWRIGEWEFDQEESEGGPVGRESGAWTYARAASAYGHALRLARPPLYGVALYKYAWTLFKQQRYQASVRALVDLLRYTDTQQKLTGDAGADFRREAYTYIAGSLTNVDFVGPRPDAPFAPRPDILETAKSPSQAERMLRVAVDRVQDARIVPQDEPWTISIYDALAAELRAMGQYKNALSVYHLMVDKWPLDPTAPETQEAVAEVFELLASQTRIGDERRGYERQVLVARTSLSHYVGDTPWVDANRDNPDALRRAEQLAGRGLLGAAATHTRNGQNALERADREKDPIEKTRLAAYALDEYRLATAGWRGLAEQPAPDAPDTYRCRYFLADALYRQVRLSATLHASAPTAYPAPSAEDIADATRAAAAVRDSDEDDALVDNAGLFVVDLADVERDLAGLNTQKEPTFTGPPGARKVVVETLPGALRRSIEARDDYVRRVQPDRDRQGRGPWYALYAAEQLVAYGHFDEARARLELLNRAHCARDAVGYEAWKQLITMSNLQNDIVRSRALARAEKAASCAWTEAQKDEERRGVLTDRVLVAADFEEARALYERRDWTRACAANEAAQLSRPAYEQAPGATLLAASACALSDDPRRAVDLYERFLTDYGSDAALAPLSDKTRDKRVRDLGLAYDGLANAYHTLFAFADTARILARTATDARLDGAHRANAARSALLLYSSMGDRDGAGAMRAVLVDGGVDVTPAARLEAEYLDASFDYTRWKAAPDDGPARRRATTALSRFHERASGNPAGARFALEAAHRLAEMQRDGGGPELRRWWAAAIADWESLDKHPDGSARATDAPYADYAAEAEFALVDAGLRADFDFDTGHHRYGGPVADVTARIDSDLEQARRTWMPRLDRVAQRYGSLRWAAAATAREGSLYDAIRSGIDQAAPKYFTPAQRALLDRLERAATLLDRGGRAQEAEAIRARIADFETQVRDAWRAVKERYLDACNRPMIGRYATAAVVLRAHSTKDPVVDGAVARLAFYTERLGDEAMRHYVEATPDPAHAGKTLAYADGEFERWSAGVVGTGVPAVVTAHALSR